MKVKTYRLFSILCYDESENISFNDIFQNVLKNNLKYFYIKHKGENDDKKNHYHLMIYYDQATTISKVSKILNIQDNYIKISDDFGNRYTLKKSLGYFLHYNNKEKINYSYNDIVTNCEDLVRKYYDILTGGSDEKNELKEIIAFINDNGATIGDTLSFCIDNDYLKTFKKYSYVLTTLCRYNY